MSRENSYKSVPFWETYLSSVLKHSIPEAIANYYVKWAQSFAKSSAGPLKDRKAQNVNVFLDRLARQDGIEGWQVTQASEALRILYQDVLKVSWAQQWPSEGRPVQEESGFLPNSEESQPSFRDQANWGEINALHKPLFDRLRTEMRTRHYSIRTERAYEHWIRRFIGFHELKAPKELDPDSVKEYLEYLAEVREISASTQNQAFNAILFFFKHVLKKDFGEIRDVVRAKRRPYITVVLSREEVSLVIKHLYPPYDLIVKTLYGCGLRLFECIKLRVHNFNFDAGILTIHDGKGQKDRTVPLPKTIMPDLFAQLERLKKLHDQDLAAGYAGVFLDHLLEKKYKNAAKEFIWQWFFPPQLCYSFIAG